MLPEWLVSFHSRELVGGVQWRITFPNGWSASVVRHRFSYGGDRGLWELAVVRNGELNYKHPVSEGDVRGFLSEEDVDKLLSELAETTEAETKLYT